MTTHHALPAPTATPATRELMNAATQRHRAIGAERRRPVRDFLTRIGRWYAVNWRRAAAQEHEYLRLREEAREKYWAATAGRM